MSLPESRFRKGDFVQARANHKVPTGTVGKVIAITHTAYYVEWQLDSRLTKGPKRERHAPEEIEPLKSD